MIKNPLAQEPIKISNPVTKCHLCPSSFSPYKNKPKKEDSKKKENMPSMAKVCPIIPPVNSENLAQLVPN
ncbi:hypothetical protein D3C80_1145930 [compost metagenome]